MSSRATDDPRVGFEEVARLRMAMARLARQQRRSHPTGLTPSQQSALATIDLHGPVRPSDLARLEAVAPPTITRIVSKLEDEGLIERQADPTDGRSARVSITTIGREQMAETRIRRNHWLATMLAGLSDRDVSAIVAAVEPLERLVDIGVDAGAEGVAGSGSAG